MNKGFYGEPKIIGGYKFIPYVLDGHIKDILLIADSNFQPGNAALIRQQTIERYMLWLGQDVLRLFSDDQLIIELARRRK